MFARLFGKRLKQAKVRNPEETEAVALETTAIHNLNVLEQRLLASVAGETSFVMDLDINSTRDIEIDISDDVSETESDLDPRELLGYHIQISDREDKKKNQAKRSVKTKRASIGRRLMGVPGMMPINGQHELVDFTSSRDNRGPRAGQTNIHDINLLFSGDTELENESNSGASQLIPTTSTRKGSMKRMGLLAASNVSKKLTSASSVLAGLVLNKSMAVSVSNRETALKSYSSSGINQRNGSRSYGGAPLPTNKMTAMEVPLPPPPAVVDIATIKRHSVRARNPQGHSDAALDAAARKLAETELQAVKEDSENYVSEFYTYAAHGAEKSKVERSIREIRAAESIEEVTTVVQKVKAENNVEQTLDLVDVGEVENYDKNDEHITPEEHAKEVMSRKNVHIAVMKRLPGQPLDSSWILYKPKSIMKYRDQDIVLERINAKD